MAGGNSSREKSNNNAERRLTLVEAGEVNPLARDVADPPGFNRQAAADLDDTSSKAIRAKEADASWKQQKAWECAYAPVKNIGMMAFMLWMAGSTVHIFSIGIIFSAFWQPISALMQAPKMFDQFKMPRSAGIVDTLQPMLLFMLLNFAGLIVAMWKLNALGLLPTHPSDWLSSLPPRPVVEFSGGGVPFR
eukprot:TRINITY_DN38747_c0_g1_i1.p1 TRINITY_DN38747_c0_g1~~TRINITY_DN38747_c0_g1_i1.p1  ORF type:complete len:191 (+),score=38.92 TRINITY_DN38747_c0_g1_i1:174-746(+)